MKYNAPFGSSDPDASYVDRNTPGAIAGSRVPADAIEDPQRELVALIAASGQTPADGNQVPRAVQTQKTNYAAAGGAATAYTVTLDPAPLSLASIVGMPIRMKVGTSNSGAVTLAVNGLAATSVVSWGGGALARGDLVAGVIATVIYDGTVFRLASLAPSEVANLAPGTGAYLQVQSTTLLQLRPEASGVLWINGSNYLVPANLTVSNASFSAGVRTYVYAYMNAGVMNLEGSTTGYTKAANGIPQKTGDPTRTLVGMAVANSGTGLFQNQGAGTLSYFNRKSISATSNGEQIGSSSANPSVELNSAARANFIAWSDNAVNVAIIGYGFNSAASVSTLSTIGVDGTVITAVVQQIFGAAGSQSNIAQTLNIVVADGTHFVSPFGGSGSGGTASFRGLGATVLTFG